MADKVDKILTEYFTGLLAFKIKQRELDLTTQTTQDDNIGGGRAKNKYNNTTEDKLIKLENDKQLATWKRQHRIISEWSEVGIIEPITLNIARMHYSKKYSWQQIANINNVSVSTAIKKRYEFKKVIAILLT